MCGGRGRAGNRGGRGNIGDLASPGEREDMLDVEEMLEGQFKVVTSLSQDYGQLVLPLVVSHTIDKDSPLYHLQPGHLANIK